MSDDTHQSFNRYIPALGPCDLASQSEIFVQTGQLNPKLRVS